MSRIESLDKLARLFGLTFVVTPTHTHTNVFVSPCRLAPGLDIPSLRSERY